MAVVRVPCCLWGVAAFHFLRGKALPSSPMLLHGEEFLPSLGFPATWVVWVRQREAESSSGL